MRQVEQRPAELVIVLLPSLVRTMLAAFVEGVAEDRRARMRREKAASHRPSAAHAHALPPLTRVSCPERPWKLRRSPARLSRGSVVLFLRHRTRSSSPVTVSLTRDQAERLTARAIREGKDLNALEAEILKEESG